MTSNTIDTLIGVTWIAHALVALIIGWELIKTARRYWDGRWWPIPGRVLMAVLFVGYLLMFLDIVRLRFDVGWIDRHLDGDPNRWNVLLVRLLSIPVGLWIAVRLRRKRRILTDSEIRHDQAWDGVTERRSGRERRRPW